MVKLNQSKSMTPRTSTVLGKKALSYQRMELSARLRCLRTGRVATTPLMSSRRLESRRRVVRAARGSRAALARVRSRFLLMSSSWRAGHPWKEEDEEGEEEGRCEEEEEEEE